jgi:hypothetical protein
VPVTASASSQARRVSTIATTKVSRDAATWSAAVTVPNRPALL